MSIEIEAAPAPMVNGKVHAEEVQNFEFDEEEKDLDVAEWEKTPRSGRRLNLRRLIIPAAAVVLVIGAAFGVNMYREGQMYVTTDNAQLTGTPVQVGAMNAGRV
jgi:hypothetical protein